MRIGCCWHFWMALSRICLALEWCKYRTCTAQWGQINGEPLCGKSHPWFLLMCVHVHIVGTMEWLSMSFQMIYSPNSLLFLFPTLILWGHIVFSSILLSSSWTVAVCTGLYDEPEVILPHPFHLFLDPTEMESSRKMTWPTSRSHQMRLCCSLKSKGHLSRQSYDAKALPK